MKNLFLKIRILKIACAILLLAICNIGSFNIILPNNKTQYNNLSRHDKTILRATKNTIAYIHAKNIHDAHNILKKSRLAYAKAHKNKQQNNNASKKAISAAKKKAAAKKAALEAKKNAPKPLRNLAAQCYFNAMYQCLVQIQPIKQELIAQFGKEPYEKVKQFTINQFSAAGLAGMGQQDPAEVLNFILAKIPKKAPLYTFNNKITNTCSTCKKSSSKKELFNFLAIYTQDHKKEPKRYSLQALIQTYYKDEPISDQKTRCSLCGAHGDFILNRSTMIEKAPNIFISYINRILFDPTEYARQLALGKNNNAAYAIAAKKIETPTPFALQNLTFGKKKFNLVGCCMQSGNALGSHYISFVRSYNQWYLCNDFSINKVSLKNMQTIARSGFYKTFQPVLFFYEQIKPKSIIRKKTHADAKKITPKKKAKK